LDCLGHRVVIQCDIVREGIKQMSEPFEGWDDWCHVDPDEPEDDFLDDTLDEDDDEGD